MRRFPAVVDGGAIADDSFSSAPSIAAEIPKPPAKLVGPAERAAWKHVTEALYEYGLIHRTDAMMLLVIVRTFARWVQAEDALQKHMDASDGSYIVTTPNGYEQPHQMYYVARNLRVDLLKWLPEAALTIPSFRKAMGERAEPDQADMFGADPVAEHKKRKVASMMAARGRE